jgi:maltose alpha-D-glucosyltransferase / alpha-amylase
VSSVRTAEVLREARWFGGKSRAIADTRVVDSARWLDEGLVYLVEVTYASGTPETYVLADRLDDENVARAILGRFQGDTLPTEKGGRLVFRPTHVLNAIRPERLEPVTPLRGEQSNTSIRFGDALILKLFRRLQFGPNPDVEIGWFLTEHTSFAGTPPVAGSLSYIGPNGDEASLALLQQFEPNRGDAWTTTLARLCPVLDGASSVESLQAVRRLGATTAELHVALASGDGEFTPELISGADVDGWLVALEVELRVTADALSARGVDVDLEALAERAAGLRGLEGALKTRHHGDYHLGQVLERDDGAFVIIDFEGEPSRALAQRRQKRSPLRDVAGMLRSFDYARVAALRAGEADDPARIEAAQAWYTAVRQAFLTEYLSVARLRADLLPEDVDAPLAALELEKAAYEVLYELNNRPDWLPIPLAAFTT